MSVVSTNSKGEREVYVSEKDAKLMQAANDWSAHSHANTSYWPRKPGNRTGGRKSKSNKKAHSRRRKISKKSQTKKRK